MGSNDCVKVKISSTKTSLIGYAKGCAKTCNARDVPACQDPAIKCEIHCCSGNYCNAGPTLVISGVFIMSCALIAAALG